MSYRGGSTSIETTTVTGTPSLLRAINERTVLDCVRRIGPISRAQLARETALSKPTVSQALAGLQQAGLVREAGRSKGGKGPTAILYQLNPRAGWVVGIDVGRNWVRAAIADVTGAFVARRDERAKVRSAETLISQIGQVAHGLASDAGIKWRQVTVAAVGSPGVVHPGREEVELAHSLPGWGRHGLVELVHRELGTNTIFENDVNLAALGERWHGLGRDVDEFVYLHIGTGVGLGIVVHGELYRGAGGAAGEVGYLPLWGTDVRAPASRKRGALDRAASGGGVVEAAKHAGMTGSLTAERVFAAAAKGDRVAKKVVAQEADRVAMTIAAVAAVLDPALVILGGGIGSNAEVLLAPVRERVRELSPFRPAIEASELREEATLHGSVSLALQAAHARLFDRSATA